MTNSTLLSESKSWISTLSLAMLCLAVTANSSGAQVAITLGAEGVYDDNIYLEDKRSSLPPLEEIDPDGKLSPEALELIDGKPNKDFITNIYTALSGPIPTGRFLETALEGRFGAMLFGDQTDETRLVLEHYLSTESTPELLSDPLYVRLVSYMNSSSTNIGVAAGATARQSQTHTAQATLGLSRIDLSPKDYVSADYTLSRHDYLKQFTFRSTGKSDDFRDQGADYFSNRISATIGREVSPRFTADLRSYVDYVKFTGIDSAIVSNKSDLDRLAYGSDVGFVYSATERLTLGSSVGFDGAHYPDLSKGSFEPVENNGQPTRSRDDNEIALVFEAFGNYALDERSVFTASVDQRTGTNVDGNRVIARSVALTLAKGITERLSASGSGRFLQFNEGDSLSGATERWELTTSLRYLLRPALSVALGYNYANQDRDNSSDTFFSSGNYKVNRVFLSINAGLVGLS